MTRIIKLFFIKLDVLLRMRVIAKFCLLEIDVVNVYTINIECASIHDKYFSSLHDDGWLWHRRLGHASMI